jgi:tRNA(fMet)-specific endonuclease VapC
MVERVVVDTDVISFVFKGHRRAADYSNDLDGKQIVVSFMTVAELKRWALEKRWGANRIAKLDQQLRQVIVYPVDLSLCQKWAEVVVEAKDKGRPISAQDAWIAATALQENLPLVTNNSKDFAGISALTVISHE